MHSAVDQHTGTTPPAQKPSVGRIVQFFPRNTAQKPSGYPAVITQVWGDTCVNLHVFDDGNYPLGGGNLKPTSVGMRDADNPDSVGWQWPSRV